MNRSIHYVDFCEMGMLKKLAPSAYEALLSHYSLNGETTLKDTDIVVFEGFRAVNPDGTFGPHNVVKTCGVTMFGPNCKSSDVWLGVFTAVMTTAYTYGATHNITRQMFSRFGITCPDHLTDQLKEMS